MNHINDTTVFAFPVCSGGFRILKLGAGLWLTLPLPFPPLPLEVGPLNSVRGSEGELSSHSGVCGGALTKIKFGAF